MEYFGLINFIATIIIAAIILVIIISRNLENKRHIKLKEFANLQGFEFDKEAKLIEKLYFLSATEIKIQNEDIYPQKVEEKKKSLLDFFKPKEFPIEKTGLEIFKYGDEKVAKNLVLVPYNNTKLIFMDYYYVVNSNEGSSTHKHTIALLKSQNMFPEFYLIPENFFHKLAALIGFEDIDIEGFEEFSKMYYLKGKDKIQILNFFTPERIMVLQQNPGWHIYAKNNYLAAYKKSGYVKVEDYQTYIEEVKNLFSLLKI